MTTPDPAADYAARCREYADATREELVRLALNAETETVRLGAIKELNDRGFGKSGPAGESTAIFAIDLTPVDVARRIAFVLRSGAAPEQEGGQ